MLGFLPNLASNNTHPSFIPTTASSFSLDAPDYLKWRPLDCRHGRAVFRSLDKDIRTLLVWEPITGAQKLLPVPLVFNSLHVDFRSESPTAAVLCAADGCDHRDCLGGPFRVVFIFEETRYEQVWASVFSSETGAWDVPTLLDSDCSMEVQENSSVLVGSSLLYFRAYDSILDYDLERHTLTMFNTPLNYECDHDCDHFCLVLTKEGRLGVIDYSDHHLKLWTRENARDGTDARWVQSRVIYLCNLLPASARLNEGYRVEIVAFVEGANVIFVNSVAGLITIELQSEEVRVVFDGCDVHDLVPVVTFYTPVLRGDQQYLLVPKPSEEADGEEEREGEKTMEHAQYLFDKGSNATNEGDLVNSFECISLDHDIG